MGNPPSPPWRVGPNPFEPRPLQKTLVHRPRFRRKYRVEFSTLCADKRLNIRPYRNEPRTAKRTPKTASSLTNPATHFRKSPSVQTTGKLLNPVPFGKGNIPTHLPLVRKMHTTKDPTPPTTSVEKIGLSGSQSGGGISIFWKAATTNQTAIPTRLDTRRPPRTHRSLSNSLYGCAITREIILDPARPIFSPLMYR